MKKRLLSLFLVMTLVLAFGMTAFATEATADPAVQASYDAFGKIKTAMENKDLEGLRTATVEFEDCNNELSDEQMEALETMVGDELYEVVFTAAAVVGLADAKDAFLADKNAETALLYTDNYKLLVIDEDWGADTAGLIKDMIPDGQAVYEEALAYVPGEGVLKVYEAYQNLEVAVMFQSYDEDFLAAFDGFEAVLDIFNELTEDEMAQLASLMGKEDAEDAFSTILADWITANVVHQVGQLYDAYVNDPNEDTASAFVEYYNSIYNDPEYVDEDLRAVVEGFFIDIHDLYEEAKAYGSNDSITNDSATDAEVEDDKEASPKTGDESSVILPLVCMVAAAAVVVMAKKRRV